MIKPRGAQKPRCRVSSLGDRLWLPIFLGNVPSPPSSPPDTLAVLVRIFSTNLPEQGMVHQLEEGSVCPSAGPRTTPPRTKRGRGTGGRPRREGSPASAPRCPPRARCPLEHANGSRKRAEQERDAKEEVGKFLKLFTCARDTNFRSSYCAGAGDGWGAHDRCSAVSSSNGTRRNTLATARGARSGRGRSAGPPPARRQRVLLRATLGGQHWPPTLRALRTLPGPPHRGPDLWVCWEDMRQRAGGP